MVSRSAGVLPSGRNRRQSPVLIVGLGRFGVSLATQLVSQGREVLAVERDHGLVQKYADSLTHVVEGDASDIEALQQLGAQDFSTAVVGVGTSIESSVLVAVNLVDLGVEHVWAKAINKAHGKILTRIGCHHVVFPEHDAGVRVAHLVANQMTSSSSTTTSRSRACSPRRTSSVAPSTSAGPAVATRSTS